MALTPASEQAIRNAAPNRGRLGTNLAEALIGALRTAGQAGDVPTPHVVVKTTVTATGASHIVYGGACRLYAMYVDSPTAAVLGSAVRVLDGGTVVLAGTWVTKGTVSGVLWLSGADGIGLPIVTDLRIHAVKLSDGTTTPDSGDNPDVTCIIGY